MWAKYRQKEACLWKCSVSEQAIYVMIQLIFLFLLFILLYFYFV